jgi:hypothetical protein
MTATSTIRFSDLSRQKRFSTDLEDDLTPNHTVDQAIDLFLESVGIPDNDLPWTAFSRGVRLDKRTRLGDLTEDFTEWTVLPTVSAGAD